jgi:ribosomal protein L4
LWRSGQESDAGLAQCAGCGADDERSLNTYDVLRPDKLVFTRNAFEQLEARLGKE